MILRWFIIPLLQGIGSLIGFRPDLDDHQHHVVVNVLTIWLVGVGLASVALAVWVLRQ